MPERLTAAHPDPPRIVAPGDAPPPEIAEFIRYCHDRRAANWPELYDEMCAVASRGEFNGWGHEQLADHGVSFALGGMPRLAIWVRATLAAAAEPVDLSAGTTPAG